MSTMSQLGEFIATIQNNQDVRTAALEERLAQLEAKDECGCAETITALEQRLAAIEAKDECGCAETITALEERLATLEAKEECGCGSYDELLASYEQRISALEGNAGGGTEGEGGSTEGEGGSTEGEGGDSGSTEPIPASQALAKYNHLMGAYALSSKEVFFMSAHDHKYSMSGYCGNVSKSTGNTTLAFLAGVNEGDIVKVYTPDLQEIEIIADSTHPYYLSPSGSADSVAFGNKETKEVYCYYFDPANKTIAPCTDEAFIAQWGNSDALGL